MDLMKVLVVLPFFSFMSFAQTQQEKVGTGKTKSTFQECQIKRFQENEQKMGLSNKSLEPISFEDNCETKNLCFTAKALKDVEISGLLIPKDSDINFCERDGIKKISSLLGTISDKKGLSCKRNVFFNGIPSQLCFCEIDKAYTANLSATASITITLPPKTSIYLKDGMVTHFELKEHVKYGKQEQLKPGWHTIVGNLIVAGSSTLPECNGRRDLDEDHLFEILTRYDIRRVDISNLSYSNECTNDGSRMENVSYSSISGVAVSAFKNKQMNIPEQSYLSFCNGHIVTLSASENKEIGLWGHFCKRSIESSWDVGDLTSKEKYRCVLAREESWEGIHLPKRTKIYFDKEKILCISGTDEKGQPIQIAGQTLGRGTYSVAKGKFIRNDDCY